MSGFTLIELIITITLVTTLSLMAVTSLAGFQKQAMLDDSAREIVSLIRSAQTKSVSGTVTPGETYAPDHFPAYGVFVDGADVKLIRLYRLSTDAVDTEEPVETLSLAAALTLTPSGTRVMFDRLSGKATPVTLTLTRTDGQGSYAISVNAQAIISAEKI